MALVFVGNDCVSIHVRHFVCQGQDKIMDEKISRYEKMDCQDVKTARYIQITKHPRHFDSRRLQRNKLDRKGYIWELDEFNAEEGA